MAKNSEFSYYRQIVTSVSEGIAAIDEMGIIRFINPALEKMFGYYTDELLDRNVTILMRETDALEHSASFDRYSRAKKGNIIGRGTFEVVAQHRDGHTFPVGLVVSKMKIESEKYLFVGTMRDISWRKKAEETLRISEERFGLISRASKDGIWDWDLKTKYIYFSPRWKEMLGYEESEIKNNFDNMQLLIHSEDLGLALEEWVTCMEDWSEAFSFEYRLRHKNGNYIWILCRGLVLLDEDGEPVRIAGSHSDISVRKQYDFERAQLTENLEIQAAELRRTHDELQASHDQLLQSEKLASIGQLAAGVAHEINNPVGYVYSNLNSLQKYVDNLCRMLEGYEQLESLVDEDQEALRDVLALKKEIDLTYLKEDVRDLVDESRDGISRVKGIVQDLKDFSHVDEAEWQWIDLHQGIDSTLNIVINEIKYKAEIIKEYGELPEVECLASQLNQVFMNLLVNAAHAIEERGVITIRTGVKNQQAWVSISDTGSGIDTEHVNKIFDPFFTTKPVGTGTGLGLSLSYSIVQKHCGTIEVESERGKGTTFTVRVPLNQPEVSSTTKRVSNL